MKMTNLGLINVIIISFVWSSDSHHNKISSSVKAEVVHRGPEEVGIIGQPFWQI